MPSGTDEETFDRAFCSPDWAVMFILAQHGATYGRLRYNVGPSTSVRLGLDIDYTLDFPATDPDAWLDEYENNVRIHDPFSSGRIFDYGADDSILDPMDIDAAAWHANEWVAS
ncbi:hypothetical protein Q31b_47330 [Novipirellula aureliae]|uniref:Uncharacterized protein n=2 Tax=Novipirellula aureliae TaxID=2527966 RepID=A0A5C6DP04_9BACT|nr:hypothetical protein Q31b_47330 [Novipirellula aureliae]